MISVGGGSAGVVALQLPIAGLWFAVGVCVYVCMCVCVYVCM